MAQEGERGGGLCGRGPESQAGDSQSCVSYGKVIFYFCFCLQFIDFSKVVSKINMRVRTGSLVNTDY